MKVAVSIFVFIISAGAAMLFLVNVKTQENVYVSQPVLICGNSFFDTETSEKAKAGKQLFNANCAACHKLNKQSTGPYLRDINERFATEDIIKFVRNDSSSKIKSSGENSYKCIPFPNLSDEDIQSILAYTN